MSLSCSTTAGSDRAPASSFIPSTASASITDTSLDPAFPASSLTFLFAISRADTSDTAVLDLPFLASLHVIA